MFENKDRTYKSGATFGEDKLIINPQRKQEAGSSKRGSITVPLTSCLTGLD
jgi:hypothetical protein